MKEDKNDQKTKNSVFIIFPILVIVSVIFGFGYMLVKSNTLLNSNELKNNINNNLNINNPVVSNSADIEKEITYQEIEISSFTSTLYDNSENRIHNITMATSILNDTVIKIGQEFSFNGTIGPMGEQNGYKLAAGFDSNGKIIQVPAGGMCQVSSTLYNVALIANLEITERHPHSRRVNYVPVDKDATVYYPDLDLKFVNNTNNDIKIIATNNNYSVTIKFFKIEQSN